MFYFCFVVASRNISHRNQNFNIPLTWKPIQSVELCRIKRITYKIPINNSKFIHFISCEGNLMENSFSHKFDVSEELSIIITLN